MIGLVIVTHGRLADEFVLAMEHVVGPQEAVAAICIGPEDDMESAAGTSCGPCAEVDSGKGVILLTDMFGGTRRTWPSASWNRPGPKVIAGLNLPMLIKLASLRTRENLDACVHHAQEAGRKYISVASYVLAGEK